MGVGVVREVTVEEKGREKQNLAELSPSFINVLEVTNTWECSLPLILHIRDRLHPHAAISPEYALQALRSEVGDVQPSSCGTVPVNVHRGSSRCANLQTRERAMLKYATYRRINPYYL